MIIYDWGPLKKICPTESFILYRVAIYSFRTFIGYVWLEKALPELFWKMAARGRMVENISKNKIFLCSYELGRDFVYSEFFFRSCKKRCRSPQNRRFWAGEIGAAPLRGQMSDMSVTLNSVTDICPLKKLTTVFTVQAPFSQLCL